MKANPCDVAAPSRHLTPATAAAAAGSYADPCVTLLLQEERNDTADRATGTRSLRYSGVSCTAIVCLCLLLVLLQHGLERRSLFSGQNKLMESKHTHTSLVQALNETLRPLCCFTDSSAPMMGFASSATCNDHVALRSLQKQRRNGRGPEVEQTRTWCITGGRGELWE